MSTANLLIKSVAGYVTLLVVIRVLGKKQHGELNFFNYITGTALGNIAGDMIIHKDVKLLDAILALIIWTVITFSLGYFNLKSSKVRHVFNGEPAIVIKKGVILHDILASHGISMDDLSMLLRNNNVFSIKDVDYAILEPNGRLSILKKPEKETVTRKDLKIPASRSYMPSEIIVDGKIVERNLKELDLNNEWLGQQLKRLKVTSIKDIFYGELQEDGSLYVIKK